MGTDSALTDRTADDVWHDVVAQAADEEARIRALEDLGILGAGPEDRFDRIARLAQQVFGVAAAAVTLVDDTTQHHKAQHGVPLQDGPREGAFCNHTIREDRIFVVEDATTDPRFAHYGSVTGEPHIRFYAGHPLTGPGGHRVGALCLVDDRPRSFSRAERAMLAELAGWAQREVANAEELERAAVVQRALLPARTPDIDGYDVAGFCRPTGKVGGDFFDWHPGSAGEHVLTLGDVMGKGMQAAIMMATVRAVMRSTGRTAQPAAAVQAAAETLHDDLQRTDALVTLCHARVRTADGQVAYTDAGHGLMLLVRADGSTARPPRGGLPLGWPWEEQWPQREFTLLPGDTVVVFSDGLLDLHETTNQTFEEVAEVVRRSADADAIVQTFAERVHAAGTMPDDVTLVAIRRSA